MRRRLFPIVVRSLLASLLLASLLVSQISFPAAHAADSGENSGVNIAIDPADSSVWIAAGDSNTVVEDRTITHYSLSGAQLSQFVLPQFSTFLGFALEPGAHRLYYMRSINMGESGTPTYYNLDDPTDIGLVVNKVAGLDVSHLGMAKFSYNPVTKHFYATCCTVQPSENTGPNQGVIIDVKTNTIIGTMPVQPVAYNPTTGKVYATRYYHKPGDNSQFFYDLITLDNLTETATGTALMTSIGPFGTLSSIQVNSKTGLVYIIAIYSSSCAPNCIESVVFDQNNKVVQGPVPTAVYQDYALNEATNQIYSGLGMSANHIYPYTTVSNAADLNIPLLIEFLWQPVIVDQVHNRVYGFISSLEGAGVVVADGTHLNIINTLNIHYPTPDLKSKTAPLAQLPANFQGKFFPQTGHTLSGTFLDYWNAHGGLAIFGYPLTEPFIEHNTDLNQDLTVQYFERARFELHPENQPPYNVLLGRLGVLFGEQGGPSPFPTGKFGSGQTRPVNGGVLFAETGHTLTGKFYQYWQANGGLAVFGLPLTEPSQEVNPIDGKTYLVQYFERNRFELHPEFAGSPYEVELGLLGVQYLRIFGWL